MIMCYVQQYGMSVTMCLLNQAERIYSTVSVLDIDTEPQTEWQVICYFAAFVPCEFCLF